MPAKNTPATPQADPAIPVRLNLLVRIDPAKWQAEPAPALDPDKLVAALVAAGMAEDAAKAQAASLAKPAASGPQAVRSDVRSYVLGAVKALDKLTAAGAIVLDADRDATR
jgi:hypothetical protein